MVFLVIVSSMVSGAHIAATMYSKRRLARAPVLSKWFWCTLAAVFVWQQSVVTTLLFVEPRRMLLTVGERLPERAPDWSLMSPEVAPVFRETVSSYWLLLLSLELVMLISMLAINSGRRLRAPSDA